MSTNNVYSPTTKINFVFIFIGCVIDTFWTNPQFRVRIEELDEDCAGGNCPENILVCLMQIHEKKNRSLVSNHSIGFCVFPVSIKIKSNESEKVTEYVIHNNVQ